MEKKKPTNQTTLGDILSLKHLAICHVRDPLLLTILPCSADCCHAPFFSSLTDLDSSENDDDNENVTIQKQVARMPVLKRLHWVFSLADKTTKVF